MQNVFVMFVTAFCFLFTSSIAIKYQIRNRSIEPRNILFETKTTSPKLREFFYHRLFQIRLLTAAEETTAAPDPQCSSFFLSPPRLLAAAPLSLTCWRALRSSTTTTPPATQAILLTELNVIYSGPVSRAGVRLPGSRHVC